MNETAALADLPVEGAAAPNQWLVIGASSLGTVFEWYDFYIYGLLAHHSHDAILLGRERSHRLHFRLGGVRGGIRGAAFRRAGVRPPRRSGRPQAHLPHHHEHHGRRDFPGRLAAELRDRRAVAARLRWWRCGCCRDSRSAASTAARRPTWPSTRRPENAGSTRAGFRPPRRSGLFAALLVVIGTRTGMGEDAFKAWGWRIPFLVSLLLLDRLALDPHAARREPGVS